ncbi:MAG TPA: hypothetical protein VNR59_13095, partial [Gaiellaceae bacterium]|nr:hypothetical protein [Gaiellaceae bacterium]
MTPYAIATLSAYNLVLAGMGSALMFALRPELALRDFFRLAGVSYLLGVAAAMVTFSIVIVLGIPFGWPSMVVCVLLVAGAGTFAGLRRRSSGRPGR